MKIFVILIFQWKDLVFNVDSLILSFQEKKIFETISSKFILKYFKFNGLRILCAGKTVTQFFLENIWLKM